MPTLEQRVSGGIWGLLVGDALGVPYEFHDAADLPPLAEIEFRPPEEFRRSYAGIKPGTWSDDGAQALCLLASLLQQERLDPEDLGRRLRNWLERGYMAVGEEVFDVGIQTGYAIDALRRGTPAIDAGGTDAFSNGNGSLMRVLPLAIWHRGTDDELVTDAHLQSRVTHAHPRSQVCCALYCLWARNAMRDSRDPWQSAVASLRAIYADDAVRSSELEQHVRPDDLEPVSGSGYVVDCLRSARWAVAQGDYEQAVKAAVALGNDTDTTACVTGGVAGLRDGLDAIPERWRTELRDAERFAPLLRQLLTRFT
jgi:ADP-ribosylglycohydrolase